MKKKDQMLAKIKRQQEITDGARAANRDLTDDETREFNNLQGEIDALRPQVEEEERQAAITAERNRVAEINAICRQVGMEPDNYIKEGSTVEAVRKAALDQMIQRGQPSGVHVTQDEGDKVRAAAVDGLLMRAGVTVENPTDGYDSSIDYDALNGETVSCAATPAPHCEVLEICKDILAEKGITLDIQEYDDYIIPNNIVEDGQCDTNYFQHQPYLDDFNAEHGTHLVTVAGIHVEPMGIYGGKQDSLAPIEG